MPKILALLILIFAITACSGDPQRYDERGNPESLIDYSSEQVSFSTSTPNAANDLAQWVRKDKPTRAELSCDFRTPRCNQIRNVLADADVPHQIVTPASDSVVLFYERVMVRDCDSRYVDNLDNPYNYNHPTFGCANAANMVQMIGNKKQLIAPALVAPASATSAIKALEE